MHPTRLALPLLAALVLLVPVSRALTAALPAVAVSLRLQRRQSLLAVQRMTFGELHQTPSVAEGQSCSAVAYLLQRVRGLTCMVVRGMLDAPMEPPLARVMWEVRRLSQVDCGWTSRLGDLRRLIWYG